MINKKEVFFVVNGPYQRKHLLLCQIGGGFNLLNIKDYKPFEWVINPYKP